MHRRTQVVRAILVAALLTSLAACGANSSSAGNTPDSPSSASTNSNRAHNKADVTFATQMIPHHAQAIQMAQMAINKSRDPAVLKLAKKIEDGQSPEIKSLTSWLKGWGVAIPKPGMTSMPGMSPGMSGMGAGGMSRMMTASGGEFDRRWLKMMTAHHKGAVQMAQIELRDGRSADARNLARRIVDAQQAEIKSMQAMLDRTIN